MSILSSFCPLAGFDLAVCYRWPTSVFNKRHLSGVNDSFVCFIVRDRQNKFTYYRFSDKLSILSFCINIWFVTGSLIQSSSDRERESSVWNYFKFEKGVNKIVVQLWMKKDMWNVVSGQLRVFKTSKFELKLELKLELKWFETSERKLELKWFVE